MIVFDLREDSTRNKAHSYKLSEQDIENDSTTGSLFLSYVRRMLFIIVNAVSFVVFFQ